jgi:hypothetical protein
MVFSLVDEASWLHLRPDYVRIIDGVCVPEAEQYYRGKRKYFRFGLRSAAISSTPRAAAFATVFIEVGDTELRPFCFSCAHFHSRFRKDRKLRKRGNALIDPAIGRKIFSCRSKYQKEYF